jgi:hypothetical protein
MQFPWLQIVVFWPFASFADRSYRISQSPFSSQFADIAVASRCYSLLLTPPRCSAAGHPTTPTQLPRRQTPPPTQSLLPLIPACPPCPRRQLQEPLPCAGPRHPKHLELGAPVSPTMVPPVDLRSCCCSSACLPALMQQSQAITQAAAKTSAGGWGPPPHRPHPTSVELTAEMQVGGDGPRLHGVAAIVGDLLENLPELRLLAMSLTCYCRWPLCPAAVGHIPISQLPGDLPLLPSMHSF